MYSADQVKPIKQSLLALKEEPHALTKGSLQNFDIFSSTGASFSRVLQSPVADFFYGQRGGNQVNLVWDGKPVFFLRLHGSYPKHSYHLLRRTAVTELDNAYIVFADNYLVRHVWEMHFFGYFEKLKAAGKDLAEALHTLITNAKLSVAGRLVSEEKDLVFFNCAAPKTSGSDLYFSHYFDVCGSYTINGQSITYQQFAAKNQAWLTAGQQTDWNQSMKGFDNRKIRKIDYSLTSDDLAFLRAYNVRLLSPAFVFTFPYKRKFSGLINHINFTDRSGFSLGETPEVRRLFFQHYYNSISAQAGGSSFKLLMEQGGVSEANLKQMLEVQDTVELQSIDTSATNYPAVTAQPANLAIATPKTKRVAKAPKSIQNQLMHNLIEVTTPGGVVFQSRNMPEAVAAILADYAIAAQFQNIHQLLDGDTRLAGILYLDLPTGEVQNAHTAERVNRTFPNGRVAFRRTYTVGTDTGILTTQWRSGDNDNFTIFTNWATDKGYTIMQ